MTRLLPLLLLVLGACTTPATGPTPPCDPDSPGVTSRATASGGDGTFAIQVGFLVLDGVYNSELMAPFDIFHHTVFHTKPGMTVFTVGRTTDPVRTFEGLEVAIDYDLESAPPIDVLVVPSAEHNMTTDLDDTALIQWIERRGESARYVLSICDGAFLLAEAGLLDGRRATTFPGDIAPFRERYPHLSVVEGVSFVADGPAITGVGGARSYDPALYLVEQLFGDACARGVARGMVLDWDLDTVRHLAFGPDAIRPPEFHSYLPGDRVDAEVTVETAAGERISLARIVSRHPGTRVVVLTIMAGAEADAEGPRAGIWCEDTFSELANLRHLILDYADRGVLFIGVLCPPVFHEARFGYDEGTFLAADLESDAYEENRRRFTRACLLLQERDIIPFEHLYFDPRFRLLGPRPTAGDIAPSAARPTWTGRFKWFEDTQTYGTPTTWILAPDLEVVGPPFFMNVYESPGRKIRYSPHDLRRVIERHLAD